MISFLLLSMHIDLIKDLLIKGLFSFFILKIISQIVLNSSIKLLIFSLSLYFISLLIYNILKYLDLTNSPNLFFKK